MDADQTFAGPLANDVAVEQLQAELKACRTEIGTLELQFEVLATIDPITGLPNLHGMVGLMEDAEARLARAGEQYAVMMIHIPELETIREWADRDVCREAVRHSAALIVTGLRRIDKVGRLDAATFVATLPSLTAAGVAGVVDRIEKLLHSVPLALAGRTVVRLRPEIAVVLSHAESSTEVPVLLRLLYEAREAARFGEPVVQPCPPAKQPDDIGLSRLGDLVTSKS